MQTVCMTGSTEWKYIFHTFNRTAYRLTFISIIFHARNTIGNSFSTKMFCDSNRRENKSLAHIPTITMVGGHDRGRERYGGRMEEHWMLVNFHSNIMMALPKTKPIYGFRVSRTESNENYKVIMVRIDGYLLLLVLWCIDDFGVTRFVICSLGLVEYWYIGIWNQFDVVLVDAEIG